MLLLGNTDIQKLVTAKECVAWLEDAYREHAENRSGGIPRADLISQEGAGAGSRQASKTIVGASTKQGITALRLNSGVVSWPISNGQVRRLKVTAANRHLGGLVMLFSNSTGEPLAVFPDRVIQRLRVGATNALAAQYLAKPSACTIGLLGSGWQAGSNLLALCSSFPINHVQVYSPNEEHCRRFAAEMMHVLECEIVCAENARQATLDVDIVVCATNAPAPIIHADWLRPGMYLVCGKQLEIKAEAYRRCDILVQHYARPVDRSPVGAKGNANPPARVWKDNQDNASVDWSSVPELRDLVVGKTARRTNDQEITCFCNNVGAGLQFAAIGARIYERACEQGLGTRIPTEWFAQDVRP